VLGVPRTATSEEVVRAYRQQVKVAHRDVGGSNGPMVALNEAMVTLRDPGSRAAYDATLPAPVHRVGRTIHIDLRSLPAMAWGKHAGSLLTEIPSDYLRWVLRRADYASVDLKKDIHAELDRRKAEAPSVEYVARSGVIHLSLDGDPPLCGSWWGWRGNEHHWTSWPGGRACKRGCFR
jgi:curved DNA-binding protein CbpA